MKHIFLLFLTILFLCNSLSLSAQPAEKDKSIDLITQIDSASYSFGVLLANQYFPTEYYKELEPENIILFSFQKKLTNL